jgi:hypothetical protein
MRRDGKEGREHTGKRRRHRGSASSTRAVIDELEGLLIGREWTLVPFALIEPSRDTLAGSPGISAIDNVGTVRVTDDPRRRMPRASLVTLG